MPALEDSKEINLTHHGHYPGPIPGIFFSNNIHIATSLLWTM